MAPGSSIDGRSDVTGRFVFAYFMKDRPQRIREIAPYHIEYWRETPDARCIAGPFADKCGGLVLFDAASLEEAAAVVEQDPFAVHALLAHWWVKEWIAETVGQDALVAATKDAGREGDVQPPHAGGCCG